MFRTGIDASCLEKEYTPLESFTQKTDGGAIPTKIVSKALLGASITTQDQDFEKKYREAIKESLQKRGIRQEKQIYKAAHLIKQIKGKFDEVFTDILNAMEPSIEHIDLYHATYLHENPSDDYVSIFGKAQGQRLTPLEFVERNKNSFEIIDELITSLERQMNSLNGNLLTLRVKVQMLKNVRLFYKNWTRLEYF